MNPGDAFFWNQVAVGSHLWVCLTGPRGEPAEVLIVSLSTRRRNSDTSCVLSVGEHEFIQHETVVRYDSARWMQVSFVAQWCELRDPIPENVMRRIYDGAAASPQIALDYLQDLTDLGFIDP